MSESINQKSKINWVSGDEVNATDLNNIGEDINNLFNAKVEYVDNLPEGKTAVKAKYLKIGDIYYEFEGGSSPTPVSEPVLYLTSDSFIYAGTSIKPVLKYKVDNYDNIKEDVYLSWGSNKIALDKKVSDWTEITDSEITEISEETTYILSCISIETSAEIKTSITIKKYNSAFLGASDKKLIDLEEADIKGSFEDIPEKDYSQYNTGYHLTYTKPVNTYEYYVAKNKYTAFRIDEAGSLGWAEFEDSDYKTISIDSEDYYVYLISNAYDDSEENYNFYIK